MFTLCELCVVCVFVFHFLQNSSSLFIVCVSSAFFFLNSPISSNLCLFSVFFCLLAYTIIQRKSETVDFNDFTFCNFYLLACFSSSSQFFLLINDALFSRQLPPIQNFCNTIYFQFFFVLNFDESNTSARAPNAPRGAATCMCVFLLNLQIGKTQF